MNTKTPLTFERAMLVYQAGICNVFAVDCFNLSNYGRNARRLLQRDFKTCEAYAQGLGAAGVIVLSASCNQAGDIINAQWTNGLDDCPFHEQANPVTANHIGAL